MRRPLALAFLLGALACSPEEAAPPSSQTPLTEGVITVEGAALPHRIVGEGKPRIVFGSPVLYPRSISGHLTEELRCVHFGAQAFVPGAGRRAGVPYGILEAAEDIEAVRKQLGGWPPSSSWGTPSADWW